VQLLRLISWPYARKHLLRYALSVVGIALGIGIAVALQGGTQTVLSDFRQTVDQIAGSCQLQVAAGEAGVPEAFIEKLQALPQVRAASPVVEALAETDVAPHGC
jgi:ABC-type lipoprotein release transport system permease subunit